MAGPARTKFWTGHTRGFRFIAGIWLWACVLGLLGVAGGDFPSFATRAKDIAIVFPLWLSVALVADYLWRRLHSPMSSELDGDVSTTTRTGRTS